MADNIFTRIGSFFRRKPISELPDYPLHPSPSAPFRPLDELPAGYKATGEPTPVIHKDGTVTETDGAAVASNTTVLDPSVPVTQTKDFDLEKSLKTAAEDVRNGDFEVRDYPSRPGGRVETDLSDRALTSNETTGAVVTESHHAAVDVSDVIQEAQDEMVPSGVKVTEKDVIVRHPSGKAKKAQAKNKQGRTVAAAAELAKHYGGRKRKPSKEEVMKQAMLEAKAPRAPRSPKAKSKTTGN